MRARCVVVVVVVVAAARFFRAGPRPLVPLPKPLESSPKMTKIISRNSRKEEVETTMEAYFPIDLHLWIFRLKYYEGVTALESKIPLKQIRKKILLLICRWMRDVWDKVILLLLSLKRNYEELDHKERKQNCIIVIYITFPLDFETIHDRNIKIFEEKLNLRNYRAWPFWWWILRSKKELLAIIPQLISAKVARQRSEIQ